MERLKFAAIFTSNLDEFFMIRVGSITDMALVKEDPRGQQERPAPPPEQLQAIFKAVARPVQAAGQGRRPAGVRLRACNVCRLSMDELDGPGKKQVDRWFRDQVRPVLSPLVVDLHHPFPHLANKRLAIALALRQGGRDVLRLSPPAPGPASLPAAGGAGRALRPAGGRAHGVRRRLFDQFTIVEKAVIAVTRNADISPEDEAYDVDEDFRQHMRKIVKKRSRLAPVRLEIQGDKGDKLIPFLCEKLGLPREQVFNSKSPLSLEYVYSLDGPSLPGEQRRPVLSPLLPPLPRLSGPPGGPFSPRFSRGTPWSSTPLSRWIPSST